MAGYKRRRIFIDSFQYQLVAFSLVYSFATVLFLAAALFLPVIIQMESGSLSPVEKLEVANQFLSLHARAWPAILLVFVLLGIHSVIVSHRIAGPLYRFRCVFKAISDGNLSTLAILRQKDYLVKEAETINEMIASLRMKIETIQEQYAETNRVFSDLRQSIDSGSIEAMKRDLESLGIRMRHLKEGLDQFKTAAAGGRGIERDFGDKVVAAPGSGQS